MKNISGIGKYSEKEMILGLKEANHSIFTLLYSSYFPMLLLTAEKYVKDIFVAEEIVQDVFIKMWENPSSLDSITVLRPYLYRSVVNQSLNYLSRQKTIERHHFIIAEQMTDAYIQDLYEEQELKVIIFKEIERLPQQCRRIFKMSRFEGLKYKEIAVALNISEKTVENHIVNALKILRPRLLQEASTTTTLYNSSACIAIATLLGCSELFLNSKP
ncbi:RNA polymerase, sigma-24 subunit, ECF subfamily [Arcticibacter svalbardensis MN12-7]|uniref:RNA polymerase, sigma-24 subunit, ECF subfamily n=1 Tax=Arcticibacter svalbardensis MN12-7 TaxID=1150600 RepID=R9H2N7_9SPHI|nr:RNA polymerase sigma-70 factor [Arcticibacter svalbardensis]EOR95479.1 RNA polymerase, sigma-24 subunit, ECF subfamily [Arcticibacter svalbardensis MN12-7]